MIYYLVGDTMLKKYVIIGCIILMVFACMSSFKWIKLFDEYVLVYNLPLFQTKPGASANLDLSKDLEKIFGKNQTSQEIFRGEWEGQEVVIREEITSFEHKYLGEQFGNGHYYECKVMIIRTAHNSNTMECISTATKISKYIGFDDDLPLSEERAHILENTLTEEYLGNKELFEIPFE